jgi:hypothetical protein
MDGQKKKRKRDVYKHDSSITKSMTSTATNHRMREEIRPAPPRSPEKRHADNFDELMGLDSMDWDGPPLVAEGPASIKIKKKATRYENSVGF